MSWTPPNQGNQNQGAPQQQNFPAQQNPQGGYQQPQQQYAPRPQSQGQWGGNAQGGGYGGGGYQQKPQRPPMQFRVVKNLGEVEDGKGRRLSITVTEGMMPDTGQIIMFIGVAKQYQDRNNEWKYSKGSMNLKPGALLGFMDLCKFYQKDIEQLAGAAAPAAAPQGAAPAGEARAEDPFV